MILPDDLPREVKIGYRRVRVLSFAEAGQKPGTQLGAASPEEGLILLEPLQSPVELANTVLHEIMHHLWSQGGLDYAAADDRQEAVVRVITNGLCAVMIENPALVAWLLNALASETPSDDPDLLRRPRKRNPRVAR